RPPGRNGTRAARHGLHPAPTRATIEDLASAHAGRRAARMPPTASPSAADCRRSPQHSYAPPSTPDQAAYLPLHPTHLPPGVPTPQMLLNPHPPPPAAARPRPAAPAPVVSASVVPVERRGTTWVSHRNM